MSDPGACLVTGGTGFIGGHLVRRLLSEGFAVRCLVRATSDTSALRRLAADGLPVELVRGDLTDAASLRAAAASCRCVVHCAAMVSDWGTVAEITAANVSGTGAVLSAAVAAGVERFVHVSSTDVYGYPGGTHVDEAHAPARFANWYAETKRRAEAEVRRAESRDGLAAVILRPATVYGPGSVEVVGEIARALRGRQMLLIAGGRGDAGLCYVSNLADAILLALRHADAPGAAFNICDGVEVSWRRFTSDLAAGLGFPPPRLTVPYGLAYALGFVLEEGYRLARRLTGLRTRPLLSRQAVDVMGRPQSFSNRQARELLGWEPRVGYEQGLAATLEWLREEYL